MKIRRICLLIAVLVVTGTAPSTAEISMLMSYQGRITNADGTPVADGNHSVRFDLYPVPVGGVSQWNETASITTVSGLFSHLLGSVQSIPNSYFFLFDSLFLQVTCEDQIQMPRTQLTTVAYSQRVYSIDQSKGGQVWGDLRLWWPGDNYGYGTISKDQIYLIGNNRSVRFDVGLSGSSSAQFPANAIQSSEMLDEPGVGSDNTTSVTLTGSSAQYLAGRTMNAPVDGYVLVIATATVTIQHSNSVQSSCNFGVSDNITNFVQSTVARITLPPQMPSGVYQFPISSQALFPITAGSHAYYALGAKFGATYLTVDDVQLSECFFPTAYTTVSTPVPPEGATVAVPKSFDADTERREAEAFRQKRLEAEVAQIKAELEAIRENIKRVATEPASGGKD